MNRIFVSFCILMMLFYGYNSGGGKLTPTKTIDEIQRDSILKTVVFKPTVKEKEASETEKKLYQQAYDIWYNGNPEEGIKELGSFLKSYPNSSLADDAQDLMGTAYTNLNDYKKALEEYGKVKLKYPISNKASLSLYEIAYVYRHNLNDYSNAEKYYEIFIHNATEEDKEWRDIAIRELVDIKLKPINLRPTPIVPVSPSTSQETNYTKVTSSNPQDDFKKWLFENTSVIDVHYESDWQIWVTLESSKYTSESNVEEIAKTIARWYAKKMNKDYAICTVWLGQSVYAKGNSN